MSIKVKNLYFSSSSRSNQKLLRKLKAEGQIRKIGPRLYTSLDENEVKEYLRRNWSKVVSKLYPNSHISYRTAFDFKPSKEGYIFLVSKRDRTVEYPGLIIRFVAGVGTLESDSQFVGDLRVSSFERASLENLSRTSKKWASRNIDQSEVEQKLEEILKIKGEDGLNQVRLKSKEISKQLGLEKAYKKLDCIIGALLSTRDISVLQSELAHKRAMRRPFDVNCISKLEILFGELRTTTFEHRFDKIKNNDHFKNKSFFDSYFSNYIEGTVFDIEEAEEIVFDKKLNQLRPKDSHDILGVYNIVSDRNEMKITPDSYFELEEIIKRRHIKMLSERVEVNAGEFKEKVNKAGNTTFVNPEYVRGTLEKGFQIYKVLEDPIARAIFISYLITEVHPFNDGNGRLSRIMFNSELAKSNLSTMIIPTAFREDYLLSLRALSRRERPKPLIKMFVKAMAFSNIDFSNYTKVISRLEESNWFLEPNEGNIIY